MKRARKFTAAAAFLLCLAGFALPRGAEAVRLTIDIPSVTETVLESGRDFYVAGRIDREGVPAAEMPLDIRVEVADAGEMRDGIRRPVRVVESRVGESGVTEPRDILFDCAGIAPWVKLTREELAASPPPGLVFRAEAPASFRDPRVKAAVTEERYAALVQGGATKECGGDYSKIYDTDLEWNYFRVTALALHEGRVVAEVYKDVMLGSVPDKILTRFSPPEHFAKALALARERGWRMYLDPFPGYWNAGLPAPCEIPVLWRANDALEYSSGFVHAVIYNISESSASQSVELGRVAFDGRMFRSDEVLFYVYDIGEPSLAYEGREGEARREGELVRLAEGERLRFSRAEIGERPEKYFPLENAGRVDWNVYNSVAFRPGEAVTLYGVVTPIQPMLSEVEPNDDGTYTIKNRIKTLRLRAEEISRGEVIIDEFPVGLERFYDADAPDAASLSLYEFRRTLRLPKREGKSLYTVTTQCFDAHGDPVEGTETIFYLWVR